MQDAADAASMTPEEFLALRSRIRHDLQAQLINIRAFCDELENSAAEIVGLMETDQAAGPAELLKQLDCLVTEDMLPCIKFIGVSTDQLSSKVTEFCGVGQKKERA